ncbi:MAG: rRNA maturation RNase YbeY [Chloroflexota bacterium]|nr:rRNA maturation RNase YbeY [Chloroflexota bacterium]
MTEQINIQVEKRFHHLIDKKRIRKIAKNVLKSEGITTSFEASLVFTNAETVQQLNRDYRGVDMPTDVLAFYMLQQQEADSSFIPPPDKTLHLGEIIISYPQAVSQAEEQGHSVQKELALLTIHGLLHLLGYDHKVLDEENKMRKKEREFLEKMVPSD